MYYLENSQLGLVVCLKLRQTHRLCINDEAHLAFGTIIFTTLNCSVLLRIA